MLIKIPSIPGVLRVELSAYRLSARRSDAKNKGCCVCRSARQQSARSASVSRDSEFQHERAPAQPPASRVRLHRRGPLHLSVVAQLPPLVPYGLPGNVNSIS